MSGEAPAPASGGYKHLRLARRSGDAPAAATAAAPAPAARPSIFGAGKPREQVLEEKGIDVKVLERQLDERTQRLPRMNKQQEEEFKELEEQLESAKKKAEAEGATEVRNRPVVWGGGGAVVCVAARAGGVAVAVSVVVEAVVLVVVVVVVIDGVDDDVLVHRGHAVMFALSLARTLGHHPGPTPPAAHPHSPSQEEKAAATAEVAKFSDERAEFIEKRRKEEEEFAREAIAARTAAVVAATTTAVAAVVPLAATPATTANSRGGGGDRGGGDRGYNDRGGSGDRGGGGGGEGVLWRATCFASRLTWFAERTVYIFLCI
jgi:uncharacterized membrane protein YgcG